MADLKYIEEITVLDSIYGIEDHEDGASAERHFFHRDYLNGKRKRFQLWSGGCGIGHADSLEEARARMLSHIENRLKVFDDNTIARYYQSADAWSAFNEYKAAVNKGEPFKQDPTTVVDVIDPESIAALMSR